MNPDTNPPQESLSEAPGVPCTPLTKRLISDAEIIRRRAEGQTLDVIAEAAGLNRSTVSAWLRHPRQAERLAQEKQLVKLERAAEKREQEKAAKAARAQKRRDREAAKPAPVPETFEESGLKWGEWVEREARAGRSGKILLKLGPITWG